MAKIQFFWDVFTSGPMITSRCLLRAEHRRIPPPANWPGDTGRNGNAIKNTGDEKCEQKYTRLENGGRKS